MSDPATNYAHFLSDYTDFRGAKKVYSEKAVALRKFLDPLLDQYCKAHNAWSRDWYDATRLKDTKIYINPPEEFQVDRLDARDWVFDDDDHGDDFEDQGGVFFKPSYKREGYSDDPLEVPVEFFRDPDAWLLAKQDRFDIALLQYRRTIEQERSERLRAEFVRLKAIFEPEVPANPQDVCTGCDHLMADHGPERGCVRIFIDSIGQFECDCTVGKAVA